MFRNLAFYRYQPRPRLRDLGFDVLPDLENNEFWEGVKDIPIQASMWAMGITCLISVVFGKGNQTPYAVNMLRRVLAVLALGHCLRFCTYISTTMPGTSERCLPGHLNLMDPPKPTNLIQVFFTRIAMNPGNNCGDLMFSGHILGVVTPVLMVQKYGSAVFVRTQLVRAGVLTTVMAILWSLIVFQGCLILMMRNHYTSDVVVSSYVAPLLWVYYNDVIQPDDLYLDDSTQVGREIRDVEESRSFDQLDDVISQIAEDEIA